MSNNINHNYVQVKIEESKTDHDKRDRAQIIGRQAIHSFQCQGRSQRPIFVQSTKQQAQFAESQFEVELSKKQTT